LHRGRSQTVHWLRRANLGLVCLTGPCDCREGRTSFTVQGTRLLFRASASSPCQATSRTFRDVQGARRIRRLSTRQISGVALSRSTGWLLNGRLVALGGKRLAAAPLLQEPPDRAGAEPAAHKAAEASIDLRSRTQLDISGDGSLSDVMIGDDVARADDHSGCAFWHSTIVRAPPLRHAAPTSGTSLDQSGICKFIISPSAIMFSFKLAMITRDPERTRNTMSTPNASARTLWALSGPV
jgi:hypothetical protein